MTEDLVFTVREQIDCRPRHHRSPQCSGRSRVRARPAPIGELDLARCVVFKTKIISGCMITAVGSTLLEVTNLTTEFRLRQGSVGAVSDVSFEVAAGECVGIVGESGCGKSTTGLSIMRLLPPNGVVVNGTISLGGTDLAELSEAQMQHVRGSEVALIPQDPLTSLNPTMKIGNQIAEGVLIHRGGSKAAARARALEVLQMVEMPRPEERLEQFPHELSGGLRQRVMIAMALACEPKLLIADEPTTALDVTIQAQILDLLDSLRDRLGMGMILVTHDMGVIAGRTDRVIVMYAGKVVEEASTEELFLRMRHPYTAALLESVPSVEATARVRLNSISGLPPDLSHPIVGCRFAPRCSRATEQCRADEPPLILDTPRHRFACFVPVDGPPPVATPSPEVASQHDSDRPPLLKVTDLVKEYPVRGAGVLRRSTGTVKAVSGVSFDVRPGEIFGLVGESGCGKTTVAKLLCMLEQADGGKIEFKNQDLGALRGAALRLTRRDIQLMFQDPFASLDPRMQVEAILREALIVQGEGSAAEQKAKVSSMLSTVGLAKEVAHRFPHEFSGGQRQRIGFARALILEPQLLVADEPVSALDVSIQAQLLNLMKDQQQERSLTMVMVSHDLGVMRYMADRIAVMYLGKIVEIGPTTQLLDAPVHPYTRGLLDAVPVANVAEARRRRGAQISGELPSPIDPPSGCRFRTRCPRAEDICAKEEPAPQKFPGGVEAACHKPLVQPVELRSSAAVPEPG